MKKIIASLITLLFSSLWLIAHAIEMNTAPTLKSNTSTTLTIEWQEVEDALGYYVYYDTTTGETAGYKNESAELIDGTEYTIEGLEEWTNYYIALTAIDIDGEESLFSPEAVIKTAGGVGSSELFVLENVEATAIDTLTLTFNTALEDEASSEREFLILNSITGEEVFVTASALDEDDASKLDIVLDRDLTLGDNYDFTIISIVDAQGRNIESGIDAITNFQVPSVFETKNPQPVITAVENTVTESLPTESGPIESQTEVQVEPSSKEGETTGGNSVTLVSTDDIEKNVEVTAKKTEELPQTGAEHILLLILALILGFGVFTYFGARKNS